MRRLTLLGRVLARSEALLALALLTAVAIVSPPSVPALEWAIGMAAAVALTVVASHLLSSILGPVRMRRMGSWARASAALGISAAVLMIASAVVAVFE